MKRRSLLFALVFAIIPAALVQADNSSVTVEISVPGMKCSGCAWTVTEGLKKLDHVSAVYVDIKTRKAILEVTSKDDPGKEAVYAAVKSSGYEGTKYHVVSESFSAAKAKFKK